MPNGKHDTPMPFSTIPLFRTSKIHPRRGTILQTTRHDVGRPTAMRPIDCRSRVVRLNSAPVHLQMIRHNHTAMATQQLGEWTATSNSVVAHCDGRCSPMCKLRRCAASLCTSAFAMAASRPPRDKNYTYKERKLYI